MRCEDSLRVRYVAFHFFYHGDGLLNVYIYCVADIATVCAQLLLTFMNNDVVCCIKLASYQLLHMGGIITSISIL